MNKTLRNTAYCALAIAFCALTSCFHKDVMNDRADDVQQSFIYSGDDGDYVITQELIFQATSKESGGGVTHISGYNECRLTSYDLSTGAMLGRVELGEQMENACEILGYTNGTLWCYSIAADLGLHTRDPQTMEVVKKETDLTKFAGYEMARPEWSDIASYYDFVVKSSAIIFTDMQGNHYYYDPAKDEIQPTEDEMPSYDPFADCLNTTAYFDKDSFASFSGSDDKKKLTWKYEDSAAELSFLNPSFFIDNSELRAFQRVTNKQAMILGQMSKREKYRDSVYTLHPILKDGDTYSSYSKMTEEERDLRNDLSSLEREIEELKRDLDDLNGPFADNNDYALNDKRYSTIIWSASSISDTAHAVVSCVDCSAQKFTQRWKLDLSSLYFDPGAAEGAGVFEDGDPEFDYMWCDVHDGKLVMIAQLQMVCIEMSSGKKLWGIEL